jgi:flagellar biosynthesis protein FlhA
MKKTAKTFSEQMRDYYNLAADSIDENLDFLFSSGNMPDVILSGRDETVVALKYEKEKMEAPMVKTKGKNEFAKRILNLAKKNKIPIVKNDELARKLYSKVSKDSLLPVSFYEDMATIYARLRSGTLKPEEKNTQTTKNIRVKNSKRDDKSRDDEMESVSVPDRLLLEIGSDLLPLVKYCPSPLGEGIHNTRRLLLAEMGFTIPKVRITDNLNLKKNEYRIKINGDAAGCACINMYLVINAENSTKKINGKETKDPVFELPALWIDERDIKRAKKAGFGVYDPVTVICTHITEICRRFSVELVGLDEVQGFINCVKKKYPVVVHNMLKYYSVVDIKKVIHGLLAERVSIKNIIAIFEALSDYGEKYSHDHNFLIEKVRQKLKRQICLQYINKENILYALILESGLEHKFIESRCETADGVLALESTDYRSWIKALAENVAKIQKKNGGYPVIFCSEAARRLVKDNTRREFPDLAVLSMLEIPADISVEFMGEISLTKE